MTDKKEKPSNSDLQLKIQKKLLEEIRLFSQATQLTEADRLKKEPEDLEKNWGLEKIQSIVLYQQLRTIKDFQLMETLELFDFADGMTKTIQDYEVRKERLLSNGSSFAEQSYSTEADNMMELIHSYPNLPYSIDKKYFTTFRHDNNPLAPITNYNYGRDPESLLLYEFFNHKRGERYSLLNDEKKLPLAELLATFFARKAVELQNLGSIYQCVTAFRYFNANRILEHGFDTPIIVPQAFKDQHFMALFKQVEKQNENNFNIKEELKQNSIFLKSDNIRDWLMNIKNNSTETVFCVDPLMQKDWENIFAKWSFPEIQNSVCGVNYEASVKQIQEYRSLGKQQASGKVDGIFVDIDGTLLSEYNGELNEELYQALLALKDKEKVTIFTNGDIQLAKERLKEAGVDINAFTIESKEKYKNCLFTGIIIDNVHPSRQTFWMDDEKKYIDPYASNLEDFYKTVEAFKQQEGKSFIQVFDEMHKEDESPSKQQRLERDSGLSL